MNDAGLWAAWRFWIVVAGVVVLVAVALLVTIWLTARRILADARRARTAAEAIRQHTMPIWEIQTSNEVAEQLLATVKSIESRAAHLVEALTGAGRR
jgi:type II secretory pathway component PulL